MSDAFFNKVFGDSEPTNVGSGLVDPRQPRLVEAVDYPVLRGRCYPVKSLNCGGRELMTVWSIFDSIVPRAEWTNRMPRV